MAEAGLSLEVPSGWTQIEPGTEMAWLGGQRREQPGLRRPGDSFDHLWRALGKRDASLRLAGISLALSGIASIIGMAGVMAQIAALGLGSIIGGVLFLAALIPLSVALLREA
jgi:hypothetical protein